jgi:hypothetical protein
VFNISRIPIDNITGLGSPITDWDRCGVYDIWTLQISQLPNAAREYYRWPSKQFPDWLSFIEYWGLPNMPGFGFIIIDDVSTPELAKSVTNRNCWKGQENSSYSVKGVGPLIVLASWLVSVY